VPLKEAIELQKEFIKIDDTKEYNLVTVKLHTKGVFPRSIKFGSEIKTKKQQICHTNQFIVAEIDAKVGGFGIIPKALDGAIVSSHYYLYNIDETKLLNEYLNYVIKTRFFQSQVVAKGSTNYASIRGYQPLDYKIPLPSLPIQKKIISYLMDLEEKIGSVIEINTTINEELKIILPSIYESAFKSTPSGTKK
jgi:type I restriction enzyme S subunit